MDLSNFVEPCRIAQTIGRKARARTRPTEGTPQKPHRAFCLAFFFWTMLNPTKTRNEAYRAFYEVNKKINKKISLYHPRRSRAYDLLPL
jgi:hypothetical protein